MSEPTSTAAAPAPAEGTTPAPAATGAAAGASPQPSLLGAEPPKAEPAAGAEAKPAEGKPAEAPKPETPAVPEKYEFSIPEGAHFDQPLADAYQAAAREAGLTQEQFSKLTPALAKHLEEIRTESYRAWSELQSQWQAEVKADPEIGGAKLNASLADARRAVEAYGGKDLIAALNATGAGNNPAVIKAFAKVGAAMAEDSRFSQSGRGRPEAKDNSLGGIANRLYGNRS